MMKLWSRVCFLVLVISRTSRGQNVTVTTAHSNEAEGTAATALGGTNSSIGAFHKPNAPSSENKTEAPAMEPTPPRSQANTTDLSHADPKLVKEEDGISNRTEEVSGTAAPNTTSGSEVEADDITMVPTVTGSPTAKSGYVILVLIILVIIVLCVILYLLRRASRTYSFDLQRPSPSHHNEPTGTFEPVYLDDLDRPVPTDDLSPPPVANGTSPPSEEKMTNGETVAPQEQPDGTGVEPSPVGTSSPTAAEDPADEASGPSDGTNVFFDDVGKQQNENNNNPCSYVGASGPFVEISLDEPALCDQLLTPPEAASSVLPFSPFSFSSS